MTTVTEAESLALLNLLNAYYKTVGKGYQCILVPEALVERIRGYERALIEENK